MGSYGQLSYTCVEDIDFRVYTDEEIKKISVLRITNDQSINELGHLSPDGLYDLRMGKECSKSVTFPWLSSLSPSTIFIVAYVSSS